MNADLRKLRQPELSCDVRASQASLTQMQELFGKVLDVQLQGRARVSYHLMSQYTRLRGLTEAMLDMYENPAMIHDFMALLPMARVVDIPFFDPARKRA